MDPITTNSLNKNNVMTTRYFNNGTIYADFVKTSDGQLYDIKNTATEIELDDIRDDVNNINTELVDLNSKINNLQGDIDLMSIDIQTDLFTPLYTSPNEITRMTALTSFISSSTPSGSSIPKIKPFEAIINKFVNKTNNSVTTVNLQLRDMIYVDNGNQLSEGLLNCVVAVVKIYHSQSADMEKGKINNFYEMSLNFGSDFQANYDNDIRGIFFPERIYNIDDGIWYELDCLYDRTNTTPCDLSTYSNKSFLHLHIPKCYAKLAHHKLFYKLFDPTTSSGQIKLHIYKSLSQGYYSGLTSDNHTYGTIVMQFDPRILKSQDLKANSIYICPKPNTVINWNSVQTSDIPPTKSQMKCPDPNAYPVLYNGTTTNYYSTLVFEIVPSSYYQMALRD